MIEQTNGPTGLPGAAHQPEVVRHVPSDRLQEVVAEAWAWELVEALKAAVAGSSHWRVDAQALLRKIGDCEMPSPPERY
jgi:hypothetical protein